MALYQRLLDFPTRTGIAVEFFEKETLIRWTWAQYYEEIKRVSSALDTLGMHKNSRVAIMAGTSLKWGLVDLAVQSLGAVTVPIDPSSTAEDVSHILRDSASEFLFIESLRDLNHLTEDLIRSLPLVSFSDGADEVLSWTEFLQNAKERPGWFETRAPGQEKDLATIVYTSGTTGPPKGVCLTHKQVLSEVEEAFAWGISSSDKTLCFLPLAHVLGRVEFWAHVYWGFEIAFAQSLERLQDNLQICQPTVMIAVPRVFEKIYETTMAQIEALGLRKQIFERALAVGREVSHYTVYRRKVPLALALKFEVAEKFVLKRIQDIFGGRLRFAVCGGAPLPVPIARFFHDCGVLILEGYGLTETTGAICVNRPEQYVFGSVGTPLGDVQIRLAEDGEILVKSQKVMQGYLNRPEETARVLRAGWLATGDIGEWTPTGELKVTDRKKDLIKTSAGKYVAPQKIEALAKDHPLVSHAFVYGDQKKFVVGFFSLSHQAASLSRPEIEERLRNHVADVNSKLASFETIKKFSFTMEPWTVENGLLTPSLKIKRKKLIDLYRDELESLYER
jgi:long-chain acyl-CoA synthetase